jgi:hypothetical protein
MTASDRVRKAEAKRRREPGGFIALPYIVIRSKQFATLSAWGNKLLLDLLAQKGQSNNGDLCATWSVMESRGWRSRDTLAKALRELLACGWIAQTRQGGIHRASLYGVTFFDLDWSSKMDIGPTEFPRGQWSRVAPVERSKGNRNPYPAKRVNSPQTNTPAVSNDSLKVAA